MGGFRRTRSTRKRRSNTEKKIGWFRVVPCLPRAPCPCAFLAVEQELLRRQHGPEQVLQRLAPGGLPVGRHLSQQPLELRPLPSRPWYFPRPPGAGGRPRPRRETPRTASSPLPPSWSHAPPREPLSRS